MLDEATIFVFGFVLGCSSIAGLASLLYSDKILTWRLVFASILYSGMSGIAIAGYLMWKFGYTEESKWLILSAGTVSGIGGNKIINSLRDLIKKDAEDGKPHA